MSLTICCCNTDSACPWPRLTLMITTAATSFWRWHETLCFEIWVQSHLPMLIFRTGRSDISGPERVSAQSTAEMKLLECLAHGESWNLHMFLIMRLDANGWAAPLHSPAKRYDSASQKQAYRVVPAHRNHFFDPASEFLSTPWWSQNPACQRCFYKPLRNCHPASEFLHSP